MTSRPEAQTPSSFISKGGLPIFIICCATIAAFSGVLDCGFVSFDDPDYVTENTLVQSGISFETILRAFTSTTESNWHPLTWISHAIDYSLFGLDAPYHHAMNLLLHLITSIFLFVVLNQLTGARWQSAFVAMVFAIHPLHVESVAWISERKDVLSGLFWVSTIWAYARYKSHKNKTWYGAAVCLFTLGLLAKPMLVSLPMILILLDVWPLRLIRFGTLISTARQLKQSFVEKLPFFALSIISSSITYWVQQKGGSVAGTDELSLYDRLTNAVLAYLLYMVKSIAPINLSFFYPHPERGAIPLWQWSGSILILIAITIIVWKQRRNHPYLLSGWLWFIVTLIPVIGIVQVGLQAMADRYMYLPLIGLSVMAAWGIPAIPFNIPFKKQFLAGLFAVAVIGMVPVTRFQVTTWENSMALYSHALAVTSRNHFAHNNLGMELLTSGNPEEAIAHFREAIRFRPADVIHHGNLARALAEAGRFAEAAGEYRWIVSHVPSDPVPHGKLADILFELGQLDEAARQYQDAIRLNPNDHYSRCKLAELYSEEGKLGDAKVLCDEVIKAEPDNALAHTVLGVTLGRMGRYEDARREFKEAIRLEPKGIRAYLDLAILHEREGNIADAITAYRNAVSVHPKNADAHFELGMAFARNGMQGDAEAPWREAISLNPQHLSSRTNLGQLYYLQGRLKEATEQLTIALQIDSSQAEPHYLFGNILLQQGNVERAKFHFSAAVRINPQYTGGRTALEKVTRHGR